MKFWSMPLLGTTTRKGPKNKHMFSLMLLTEGGASPPPLMHAWGGCSKEAKHRVVYIL